MTVSNTAFTRIAPTVLKSWLHDGEEIGLLDIREHGQYGEAHLFYASNIPYSRLELDITRLAPLKTVRLVIYDNEDEGLATLAAQALADIGYQDISILEGGSRGWARAGYQLFAGVHVPSKTFGELVEDVYATPNITAQELDRRLRSDESIVVLDGRPFSEYQKMSIPGGICCPNGELALRIQQLVPDEETTVVINCAGRTRSIIGAQTLIDLGIKNTVYALQNGTQGWYLADLALEHGASRSHAELMPGDEIAALQQRSRVLAERFSVPFIDVNTLAQWQAKQDSSIYLCDVRTQQEFQYATIPAAQHTPGGQLIQATDHYVAVWGGRIVVFDTENVRAPVVAAWLRRMGWDAVVLADAKQAFVTLPAGSADAAVNLGAQLMDAAELKVAVDAGLRIFDARPGMAYRQAHIRQAEWFNRSKFAMDAPEDVAAAVLIAEDPGVAELAFKTLQDRGVQVSGVNLDTVPVWQSAGLELVSTPECPSDAECIDFLFFVHDRHDGNKEAARQYLKWETGLISQLDELELKKYRL